MPILDYINNFFFKPTSTTPIENKISEANRRPRPLSWNTKFTWFALTFLSRLTLAWSQQFSNPFYFVFNDTHYKFEANNFPAEVPTEDNYRSWFAWTAFQTMGQALINGTCGSIDMVKLIPITLKGIWSKEVCGFPFQFSRDTSASEQSVFENCLVSNVFAPQSEAGQNACNAEAATRGVEVAIVLGSVFGSFCVFAGIGAVVYCLCTRNQYQTIQSAPNNSTQPTDPNFPTDIPEDTEVGKTESYRLVDKPSSKIYT